MQSICPSGSGHWHTLLALIMVAALSGCVPTVSQPPPVHSSGGVDPRLVGTWVSGGEDPGFAFIGQGKGGMMHAAIAKVLKNGRLEVDDFELYRAQSANGDLIMVADDDSKAGNRRYLVVRYRFAGDRKFEITWLSVTRVKRAIERREIEGRITNPGSLDNVVITAPHEVTVAWMESNAQVWDNDHPVTFTRLDDARLRCLMSGEGCPP